jgi:pimeloyl-ACP methyl ester carboxylesterase
MQIRSGDLELHVAVDGDPDAPPLVLLHGITSSSDTWEWAMPRLAARYRLLRLDFRGHGRSGRAPGAYTGAGYVADAVAVCEQLAGGPAFVIGHSLGGGTAAALAQQRPELVRAVVLEDPPLAPPGRAVGGSLLATFRQLRDAVPRLQASAIPHDTLVDVLARSPSPSHGTLGELLHPDALQAMASALLQLDASVLDPVLDGSVAPVFDASRAIPVPALVIAADPASPDHVATTEDLATLAAASPLATSHVVAGAGHLIHDERDYREIFMELTLTFLAGQP